MRKFSAILFLIVFTITTFGFVVNRHYCGSTLASVSLYFNGGCGCGDMDDNSNCCHNEEQIFQLDEDYQITTGENNINPIIVAVLHSCDVNYISDNYFYRAEYLNYKPPLLFEDITLIKQSFRI